MNWHPIATAPTDGTSLLLYDPDTREHFFIGSHGVFTDPSGDDDPEWITNTGESFLNPTHWMPLPSPPEVAS